MLWALSTLPELKTLDVNSVELVGGESQADVAILPAYPGSDLTFQKWFVSLPNENKGQTDTKCWPP